MTLLYVYIKKDGNIAACWPFRYNNDSEVTEYREMVIEVTDQDTLDSLRQRVVQILDEEKQQYAPDEFASGMPGVVTIE